MELFMNIGLLVVNRIRYHKGANVTKYGHMKVRTWLSEYQISESCSESPLIAQVWIFSDLLFRICINLLVTYQPKFSSLGSLSKNWVDEFSTSMLASKSGKTTKTPKLRKPMVMVWPNTEFVRVWQIVTPARQVTIPNPRHPTLSGIPI